MTTFHCDVARRSLQAFHDEELPVGDQIMVAAHLEWCPECADALAEMRMVGQLLRVGTGASAPLSRLEAAAFQGEVVTRAKAERDSSLFSRACEMFDDLHLIYAGLGGVVAMLLCVAVMLSTLRFATTERPDSLAAMVGFLATPGSRADSTVIDVESHARWTARFEAAKESAEEDAVFSLAAAFTRDDQAAVVERAKPAKTIDVVRTAGVQADAKLIEGLLETVANARLGPKQSEGLPEAGNTVVWMVTHTTVRASETQTARDLPLPAKKRA